MAMPRWARALALLLAIHPLRSGAEPADKVQAVLAGVDAILGPVKGKREDLSASRSTALTASLCEREKNGGGGKINSAFLCDASTLVSRWGLWNLPVHTGGKDSAVLEVRRFRSTEAAWTAKAYAVERFGGPEPVDVFHGAIGWCPVYVYWVDDLLFSIQTGCGTVPSRTKPLGAMLDLLEKTATPFEDTRAIGVGGWSLIVQEPVERGGVPDRARFRHFFKVTGVAANDVLWLRRPPMGGGPGEKIGKIPPDATCVPLVYIPPVEVSEYQGWVVVKFDGKEGWAKRRFLAEQPKEECLPHP